MLMDPMTMLAGVGGVAKVVSSIFNKGDGISDQVQDQIKGKMKAADKYGISRLAMLGVPTQVSAPIGAGDIGSAVADMGQDISRAVAAQQTDVERTITRLQLEKAGLENEYLRAQINSVNAQTRRGMVPPPRPPVASEDVKDPQRTSHLKAGVDYPTNPHMSDAQSYEDRYGELGGAAAGIINAGADAGYNLDALLRYLVPGLPKGYIGRRTVQPRYGRYGRR